MCRVNLCQSRYKPRGPRRQELQGVILVSAPVLRAECFCNHFRKMRIGAFSFLFFLRPTQEELASISSNVRRFPCVNCLICWFGYYWSNPSFGPECHIYLGVSCLSMRCNLRGFLLWRWKICGSPTDSKLHEGRLPSELARLSPEISACPAGFC